MQTNIAALFQGRKVEAPAPPPKRPVGRPKLPVVELTLDEEIAAEVKAFKKRKQAEIHEGIQELVNAKRLRGFEDPMVPPLTDGVEPAVPPLTDGVAEVAMPIPLLDGKLQAAEPKEDLPLKDAASVGHLGKEYGIIGKEFGFLGGRPPKR